MLGALLFQVFDVFPLKSTAKAANGYDFHLPVSLFGVKMRAMFWTYVAIGGIVVFVVWAMVFDFISRTEFTCFDECNCYRLGAGLISSEEADRNQAEFFEYLKAEGRWPPMTYLQVWRSGELDSPAWFQWVIRKR